MLRVFAAFALLITIGCAAKGLLVYPPTPVDPGDTWPAGSTGPDCRESSPISCRDLIIGTGDPVRAFAQVTVRVTVEDTQPPATHGPVMVTFVYPTFDRVSFRGRDWDVTTTMMLPEAAAAPFFARGDAVILGANVIGMRTGGTRRVTESFAGTIGSIDLPPGQPRHYSIQLTQVCYPQIYVTTRTRWSGWLGGSGNPVDLYPRLTISGCGI